MGNTQKEKGSVLTLEGLIAVISLCATMFVPGYAIDSKKISIKITAHSWKSCGYFYNL